MFDKAAGPEVLKQHNRQLVMSAIEAHTPVSRARLARYTKLSRTSISQIVDELLPTGIIRETGESVLTGGRPGLLLELNADAWHALGVELRDTEWVVVITNLAGKICRQLNIPAEYKSPEDTFRTLGQKLAAIIKQTEYKLLPAVGVGVPGIVDEEAGVIIQSEDRGWVDVPVRRLLEKEISLRALVINRHIAGGLAESRYGAGAGKSHVIYVGVDTGVVAALIIDGQLYKGHAYGSGQIGHITAVPDGPLCSCGNRGCLELVASGRALVRLYGEKAGLSGNTGSITVESICQAAMRGEKIALDCLEEMAGHLGIAIANLINIFNPNGVVIGGSVLQHNDLLFNMIKKVIEQRTLKYHLSRTTLSPGHFRHNAGSVGTAALVLDHKLGLLFNHERAVHIQIKGAPIREKSRT